MKLPRLLLALALIAAALTGCTKEDPAPTPATPTNTTTTSTTYTMYSLAGETWVLSQYHDTDMSTLLPADDTLIFIDGEHFTWNGVACTYEYYYHAGTGRKHLNLFNTAFGNLMAMVPDAFQVYGEINGVLFSNQYYMWFERI